MREIELTKGLTREPWVIRAGLIAGVLTLLLRLVGVVVGPLALALAVVSLVLLPGPEWWADRFLIAAAALLGWLPVLGWVPKLGRTIDVAGVLLSIVVGVAVAYQVHLRRNRTDASDRRRWITPAEGLAVAIAALVTIWWAVPLLGKSTAGRMRLLFPGWDNPIHLSFLRLNMKLGSFATVQPNSPSGVRIDAAEYPQGWHQMWAEWVRLWYRHPPTSARSLVNIYSLALVLTAGLAVMLGCVAVARLCRDHAFGALTSTVVVAQLFAVGVLSMTVWFAFPNFGITVVAVAVAPSILMRRSMSPPAAFFVVSGLMLVGVYNWWPLGLLAAPTLLVATWQLWRHAGETGRRPITAAAIAFAALAVLAPIVATLHLGTSHLQINGGIPSTPWWLVFASGFALIGGVALRQAVTGETLPTLVLGLPAVLGVLGVIGVIKYNISSETTHHAVGYYGIKLGAAVAAFSLVGLAILLADAASRYAPRLRPSRMQTALVGLAAVMASLAVLQVNGYAGPRAKTLAADQTALGFQTHEQWRSLDGTLNPIANSFLDAADTTRLRAAQTGVFPELWTYVDIEGLDPGRPDWTDLWFSALVGDLTSPRLQRAYNLFGLAERSTPTDAAAYLTQLFPPSSGLGVRLVVPDSLIQPLVQQGWTVGTNVFSRSAPL